MPPHSASVSTAEGTTCPSPSASNLSASLAFRLPRACGSTPSTPKSPSTRTASDFMQVIKPPQGRGRHSPRCKPAANTAGHAGRDESANATPQGAVGRERRTAMTGETITAHAEQKSFGTPDETRSLRTRDPRPAAGRRRRDRPADPAPTRTRPSATSRSAAWTASPSGAGDNPLSPGSVGARRFHPRHGGRPEKTVTAAVAVAAGGDLVPRAGARPPGTVAIAAELLARTRAELPVLAGLGGGAGGAPGGRLAGQPQRRLCGRGLPRLTRTPLRAALRRPAATFTAWSRTITGVAAGAGGRQPFPPSPSRSIRPIRPRKAQA